MVISLSSEKIGSIGESFVITNTIITSFVVMILLILITKFVVNTKYSLKSRFYNFIEMIIEGFLNIIESIVGKGKISKEIFSIVVTLFIFIILNNWFGILPGVGSIGIFENHEGKEVLVPFLRSVNSDINMTLALAISSVVFIQVISIKHIGIKNYLHKFFNFSNPINFFIGIIELISELVKIFSFSFRLFGNIFAGDVLLIVIFSLVPYIAPIPFLGIELFAGFIQALIFFMLTTVFIKISASHTEEH